MSIDVAHVTMNLGSNIVYSGSYLVTGSKISKHSSLFNDFISVSKIFEREHFFYRNVSKSEYE